MGWRSGVGRLVLFLVVARGCVLVLVVCGGVARTRYHVGKVWQGGELVRTVAKGQTRAKSTQNQNKQKAVFYTVATVKKFAI
jgi:hypothetical protein